MKLTVKGFAELTVTELYEILRLRVDVFVVEQQCPYPEIDGKDPGRRPPVPTGRSGNPRLPAAAPTGGVL